MASTYSGAQTLDGPKLKLLDCALGFTEFLRNISNAFLFNKTFNDDRALLVRQRIDQLE
jgi:hypothetical protein